MKTTVSMWALSSQVIFCRCFSSSYSSSSVVRPSVSQVTSYHAHDSVRVTRNNNSSSSNSKRVVIWSMITDRLCSFNLLPLLFGKLFSRLLRPCEKNRFLLTAFFKANHYRPINLFCSEGKNLSDINRTRKKMKKITAGNFSLKWYFFRSKNASDFGPKCYFSLPIFNSVQVALHGDFYPKISAACAKIIICQEK